MPHARRFERYRDLQAYVHWTEADADLVAALAARVEPFLGPLIDDFYEEVARHPGAAKVITGGQPQIDRLKGTLRAWVRELFSGRYDEAYVARRWRVGWRHVEIGLDQVYTNVALSRIRTGLLRVLHESWTGPPEALKVTALALNKLLDLDLALVEDAYQAEYLARQQRSERLAAIGQVAGGIAHELRNPLNVVKTSVYYLLHARNPAPAKTAEHLERIERQVGLADGVITALSNFARLPVPDARPFAVGPLVREALETNPTPEAIAVTLDVSATLPLVAADRAQVGIVLGNLIRNARDAMPSGGRLSLGGVVAGRGVEIAVADTGVGIPPDDLGRIMEPLYTTKALGLGLGLAITRAILDKNGGGLRVVSAPGRGSTFTVTLALARDDGGPLP